MFDVSAARVTQLRRADGIWMSVGFAPANNLLHQAGAKMRVRGGDRAVRAGAVAGGRVRDCGKVAGVYDAGDRVAQGARGGRARRAARVEASRRR